MNKKIGWDYITETCEKIYEGQSNPKHYGTLVKWEFGGNDPLDGISVYDGGEYWHFVTYGLSEIYEKENQNPNVSGFGMEFTLKLKKIKNQNDENEILNICRILQNIAKMTFVRGEIFNEYEYIYTGQKFGIDVERKSNITGFITMIDKDFKTIDTINGSLKFIEFIGVTEQEIEMVKNKKINVPDLLEKLKSDFTDYNRESVI